MQQLVISILGDDRAGLVEALAEAVTRHGGNWERSQMAELAGTFAGVVLVTIAPSKVAGLTADLRKIEAAGLLNIEVAVGERPATPPAQRSFIVEVTGQDHPGIVRDVSRALAEAAINIEEFSSEVVPAPMGGQMFKAYLIVNSPITDGEPPTDVDDVRDILETVATDLMVDVDRVDD